MRNCETQYYQQFDGADVEENNHENVMVHIVPENKSKWNHIEDLDTFFTRLYTYHQQHGFVCMMLQEVLQLVQFAFVVVFSTVLLKCVNYKILFRDEIRSTNASKVTLTDVMVDPGECVASFDLSLWTCLSFAFFCWVIKMISVIYHFFQFAEIRNFYRSALHVDDKDLDNLTWHEIQQKIRRAQLEFQMCIHKPELDELDIYHRILRHKNYLVAMVNKSILPLKFNLPFLGETVFLTRSLKYNIEFILFWGPWAPFDSSWHLREEFKRVSRRREHAQRLAKYIMFLGLVNLTMAPFVLIWQMLYAFFSYAEIIKREPGSLGIRRWSLFGRLYLRHFNELDHELEARLSRAYRPATLYLSGFSSNLVAVLARNLAFLAGAVLAVLVLLTIYDEDVITVEHVLTLMTILGAVVAGCRVLIPEENLVWCPETLMEAVLAQVHYLPLEWRGKAHTTQVRSDFSKLFQFKAVYLLEELLSPLVTPFILLFLLRPKALEIVDFLRQFTVEVVGVGDVCSFAQLDVHKHGQPQWQNSITSDEKSGETSNQQEDLSTAEQIAHRTEDGKTELSLVRFNLVNPDWRPNPAAEEFLAALKNQIQKEFLSRNSIGESGALFTHSLFGMNPGLLRSVTRPASSPSPGSVPLVSKSYAVQGCGISKIEGPRSLPDARSFIAGSLDGSLSTVWDGIASAAPVAANMALSTLCLHDAIHRRNQHPRKNTGRGIGASMLPIKESLTEDDHDVATAAFSAAVGNLQAAANRMAKSN